MPTRKELVAIQDSFSKKFYKAPWKEYISGIGISTVGLWSEEKVPAQKKNVPCIAVGLRRKLPRKIVFPETYKDVPVITLITGRFRAA